MTTKGTNAKIKELKGIKPEKVSDEELKKIQETVNTINRTQLELGSMEVRKHEILHQLVAVKESLGGIQAELREKYGTIDVNINDGTINHEANVEADTKD